MNFKTYLVGGAIRDRMLGLPVKDNDYVVMAPSFEAMEQALLADGCTIFVRKPEFVTIRAKHPVLGCVDFACARKDGEYKDGRRPECVTIADTIEQDLARRDFTCNAIAEPCDGGQTVDPFGGRKDIERRWLCCVGNPDARMAEDKLRAFRALRFVITKNLSMLGSVSGAIDVLNVNDFAGVSTERIREEMLRMCRHDSLQTFAWLQQFKVLRDVIRERGIWFEPTTKNT